MGFGDELMSLGRAEMEYRKTGRRVNIADQGGNARSHELWKHNPAWSKQGEVSIVDCPGHRPYIKRWDGRRIIYNLQHRPHAGHVHLTQNEYNATSDLDFPFAVVSPSVKHGASPNKDWGEERWQEVVRDFPMPVLQLGPEGTAVLPGAMHYVTPTMRHAAAAVARSVLVMTNEGGLHHLAASMRKPAVVVHGGFTPPQVTGYSSHVNLTGGTSHSGCGRWDPCALCTKALDKITPDMVKDAAKGIIHAAAKN